MIFADEGKPVFVAFFSVAKLKGFAKE